MPYWNTCHVFHTHVLLRQSWQRIGRELCTSSLYVHWPYCKRRCTYCNFNKYIDKFVDHERMTSCLIKETRTLLKLAAVEEVTSVFFGGGTPSLAQPATIEGILNAVHDTVKVAPTAEVSIEVNPTALEISKLQEFKQAGINRLSIGIQTFDKAGLHILGRDHSTSDSVRCLEAAKTLFPSHVSVDLIFGWPGQSLNMWMTELDQILHLCDDHISLYQLTLERGTQLFKAVNNGDLTPVDSQIMEDMYLRAVEVLKQAEFERYEVSNFARQNRFGLHNLSYWTGQQYIGVGPGAHGRFKPGRKALREARIQTLEPKDWMWEVERFGHATRKSIPLTPLQQLEELLIVGLRTKWGISHEKWTDICPEKSLEEMLLTSEEVQTFVEEGLLRFGGSTTSSGLKASSEGMNIIDTILPVLLNALAQGYKRNGHKGDASIT